MQNISWPDHVINRKMLFALNKDRNVLGTEEGRKAYWIGHILRRNYFLKHAVEGKTDVTRTAGKTPLYNWSACRRGR